MHGAAQGCTRLHGAAQGCMALHGTPHGCMELPRAAWSCPGMHGAAQGCTGCGAEGRGTQAWHSCRPCPASPAPHARREEPRNASGVSRECPGVAQGMLRELWSIQSPDALLWSRGTSRPGGELLAATGPQALPIGPSSAWGVGGVHVLPQAHPQPCMGLSAAVLQLQPRSLPGSWQRGRLPSSFLHHNTLSAAPNPLRAG